VALLPDAGNAAAELGARVAFHLPYFRIRMSLGRRERTLYVSSRHVSRRAAPYEFEVVWTVGDRLGEAIAGSLDAFLIERHRLYAARGGRIYRARIFQRPWPLHSARLSSYRSAMLESQGLPSPGGEPLLHQQGEPLKVSVWPNSRIR
jgi:uncharacterized protein YqjF (DUF2071 family)